MNSEEKDERFTTSVGNYRLLEARRIKKYCAKQEKCKDCIFFNPRGYIYGSPCSISQLGSPSAWDI